MARAAPRSWRRKISRSGISPNDRSGTRLSIAAWLNTKAPAAVPATRPPSATTGTPNNSPTSWRQSKGTAHQPSTVTKAAAPSKLSLPSTNRPKLARPSPYRSNPIPPWQPENATRGERIGLCPTRRSCHNAGRLSPVSPRMDPPMRVKDRLIDLCHFAVYLLVRLFICVLQAVRIETCHRVARRLAWLATDVIGFRRTVIDDNLRHAFPKMSSDARHQLARRMWEHLFLMVAEIAHFPRKVHDTNWRDYIRFKNEAWMMRELFRNRPRVFVSGHYGNFELAGYTLGLFGFPTFTVARPLDNPYLDRFVNHFRALKGQYILPKQGSANEAAQLLEGRGTLGVLADQHAGPKGCWVDFFGRPASTHKAIAVFALTNNAPLMVGYARRLDRPLQYEMALETIADPEAMDSSLGDVTALTQWYTSVLEIIVRRAPEQYWWVHRRWRDNRPAKKHRTAA